MFSSIRKIFSKRDIAQSVGVDSVETQPDHIGGVSEHCSGSLQEMLKASECVFDENTINFLPWKRGQGKRWLRWHMAEIADKLPKSCPIPKRVNKVKFVVDEDGNPVRLSDANNGIIFLVSLGGKLRALKVAYKHMSQEREVIYEAAMMRFASPSGATPKVYGLVGIQSSQFTKVGILMEYFGTKTNYKAPTLHELLGDHDMPTSEWKKLSFKLCDQVKKLQKMGVCLTNMSTKNIILHPTNHKFMITDLGMALYTGTPLKFDYTDVPAEEFFHAYPFMAPELFFDNRLHANNDTYSLAKILHELAECLGMSVEEAGSILEPFYHPDPEKRPAIEVMQARLRMYL